MKIGYLGAGSWGFCLAYLLAEKGHEVVLWTTNAETFKALKEKKEHPKLPQYQLLPNIEMTMDLNHALLGAEMVVESVTSKGLRPVLEKIKNSGIDLPSLVITSKGIEQGSSLLLSEVALDVFGEEMRDKIGYLSGPSLAKEVMQKLPTSVVASAYDHDLMMQIADVFANPVFRVYPNKDVAGVSFGGAMKNIMAIACAISDGLGFGENTKAALMTRGLHEIRKLSKAKGALPETLNGLAGLGDLCATSLSILSRNYIFGKLLAEGHSPKQAQEQIGMVVEGAYTCVSAMELSEKSGIPVPITEMVHAIIYKDLDPKQAVEILLGREVKPEHL